jgi:S-adenosylmethionine-dependent methyltransferase
MKNASVLAEAYVRDTGMVGFELVTRSLLTHLPRTPQRIVDVGGGYGQQAIMLAQAGHSVVIVDLDPNMLAIAQGRLSHQSRDVRARVELMLGDGLAARSLVGAEFDLACCHNVLMYQDHPAPLLHELVDLVREGGLISIVSLNADSYAMRSGLQGRWREAVYLLEQGNAAAIGPIPIRRHSRLEIERILVAAGARVTTWHGVGVFTDHMTETIVTEDPEMVYLAEWLAGKQDPYRQVARCFHLLAERRGKDPSG